MAYQPVVGQVAVQMVAASGQSNRRHLLVFVVTKLDLVPAQAETYVGAQASSAKPCPCRGVLEVLPALLPRAAIV